MYLGLTLLIIDFSNFCINIRSGLDVNKNVNSRINLMFVGAFHHLSSNVQKAIKLIFEHSYLQFDCSETK